jgi:exonuclease VII large subunit
MVGIRQLQQLLASPQIPISATVLDGLQDSARQTVQLIADATTIRALQQKLRDVQQDLDKPNYPLTHEAEEALFHQRDQIKAELKSVTGPKRLRSMKSEQSNSTNRVRAAIRRAVNHVGEALPELGDHLRACLRDMNGANPCYYPDSPIVWRVNA